MRDNKWFKRTHSRVSLVAIGVSLVLSLPTLSFANTSFNTEIKKVEDFMRQAVEGYANWYKKNPNNALLDTAELMKAGYLKSTYQPPETVSSNPNFSSESPDRSSGGCGKKNSGEKIDAVLELNHVTEAFCKAYNEAHGLGLIIAKNCSETICPSGSASAGAPAPSPSITYCYNENGSYSIHYKAGIKSLTCP